MMDPESICHFIGYGPVADQVQEIEIDSGGWLGSFEPVFYQEAGGTAGAVLEDHLGTFGRAFSELL